MNIWTILIPAVVGVLIARFLFRESDSAASAFGASSDFVVVHQQRQNVLLGVGLMVTPWVLSARAWDEPDPIGQLVLFALIGLMSGGGGVVLIFALRRVLVSRDGIEIRGVVSKKFTWNEVQTIEAFDHGTRALIRLTFPSRRVAVDSTMDGFRQLVRALEVWPTGNAKPIAERAAQVLVNWRNDPGQET